MNLKWGNEFRTLNIKLPVPCDKGCSFCREHNPKADIDKVMVQAKQILDDRRIKFTSVGITGGEPLYNMWAVHELVKCCVRNPSVKNITINSNVSVVHAEEVFMQYEEMDKNFAINLSANEYSHDPMYHSLMSRIRAIDKACLSNNPIEFPARIYVYANSNKTI